LDGFTQFLKSEYGEIETEENFDFSLHASIGVGGRARLAFYPKSAEELIRLLDGLEDSGVKYYVLGNLTNVLPPEQTEKVVVSTRKLRGVQLRKNGVFAYTGTRSSEFLRVLESVGLTGAEFLSGIPCTIGGAAFMNAGASGRYLSEIVESVLFYSEKQVEVLSLQECDYAYKHSLFMQKKGVILGVNFRLKNSDSENIKRERIFYASKRAHLPKGKSMGCVFKNPAGSVAGKLIDRSGLKGLRVGGACVSEEHANFIINDNNARVSDIKTLISIVKNAVFAQYKIRLEEEICYLD
jgi:UDP-N-acetylmuramate dehydrogenase